MRIQGRILAILSLCLVTGCNETLRAPASSGPSNGTVSEQMNHGGTVQSTPSPKPTVTPAPSASPTATPKPSRKPALATALGINEAVDLRKFDGPVQSQFGGTCSAFATAAALDNLLKQKGINKLVSERHLWSTYGIYDADEAVTAANKNFLTEEKYWPVNGNMSDSYQDYASLRISQYKSHEYNMESALQGLSQGHPLVMAIQTPSDLVNCEVKVGTNSSATSGQHVIEAVGYKLDDSIEGGGYFILKNSWGTDCGENGYQYYPFQLCKRSDLYCYFIEVQDVEAKN